MTQGTTKKGLNQQGDEQLWWCKDVKLEAWLMSFQFWSLTHRVLNVTAVLIQGYRETEIVVC